MKSRPRWLVVGSVFTLAFITIVDRVCISAAKPSMARELSITDMQFGWVFGAFTLGYAIFMVPSGWLADRYGPRIFLASIVCAWSLFTTLTGLVSGLAPLFIVRVMFGCAEAGAYPTASRAIYNWMPVGERGLALGILNMGSRVGAAAGLAITSFTIIRFGWRVSFFILGAAGWLWALYWFLWYRDNSVGNVEPQRDGSWARVVFSRRGGMLLYQYFANNFTFFLVYSWFLPYLLQHFHLGVERAGLYSGVPLYCGALGTWLGGFSVDLLYRRGHQRISRGVPGIIGFNIAAVAVAAAAYAPTPNLFVILFGLAIFALDLTVGPSWTVASDLGKQNTGAVSGAMNMVGSIGSLAAAITFPYLLQVTGMIQPYLLLAAALSASAAICWARLMVCTPEPSVATVETPSP
jgi:ACS family glucarate transporter-like MFS transporter